MHKLVYLIGSYCKWLTFNISSVLMHDVLPVLWQLSASIRKIGFVIGFGLDIVIFTDVGCLRP